MDAATLSALSNVPLIGVFLWYAVYTSKAQAEERSQWRVVIDGSEESHANISAQQLEALQFLAKEHREALSEIATANREMERSVLDGQIELRRSVTRMTGLLVSNMTDMNKDEAKAFIRELLGD